MTPPSLQKRLLSKSPALLGLTYYFVSVYLEINISYILDAYISKSKECYNAKPSDNVKTNRKGSIKWTYHKERSFIKNCFILLKILFQFKNLFKKSWLDVATNQMFIFIVFVSTVVFICSFSFTFPCEYS